MLFEISRKNLILNQMKKKIKVIYQKKYWINLLLFLKN